MVKTSSIKKYIVFICILLGTINVTSCASQGVTSANRENTEAAKESAKDITKEEYLVDITFEGGTGKAYIKSPVDRTVGFNTRIKLSEVGIKTKKVLYVYASYPRIGLTMSSIESANVFQVAAAVNTYSFIGNTSNLNVQPIMTEMAMAQIRNVLSTDFQWKHDPQNDIVYCTHRDPRPATVTIRYVPIFEDVSEIISDTWIDYLVRMSLANAKIALGRTRSKYTIEGSNVRLDGETLLSEGNAELETIRAELDTKKSHFTLLN